jgi:hypothetical protein
MLLYQLVGGEYLPRYPTPPRHNALITDEHMRARGFSARRGRIRK